MTEETQDTDKDVVAVDSGILRPLVDVIVKHSGLTDDDVVMLDMEVRATIVRGELKAIDFGHVVTECTVDMTRSVRYHAARVRQIVETGTFRNVAAMALVHAAYSDALASMSEEDASQLREPLATLAALVHAYTTIQERS